MTPFPPSPSPGHPCHRRTLQIFAETVIVKATGHDTEGAYALFEIHTPPGRGMPPHLQRYDDEAIYILNGMYAVEIGQETIELETGGYTFVPRGTIHAYTNTGSTPAQLLALTSPGGIHEQFFAAIGKHVESHALSAQTDESYELRRIALLAEKYGIEFVPDLSSPSGEDPPCRRARLVPRPHSGQLS